jgi:hypothetical protein
MNERLGQSQAVLGRRLGGVLLGRGRRLRRFRGAGERSVPHLPGIRGGLGARIFKAPGFEATFPDGNYNEILALGSGVGIGPARSFTEQSLIAGRSSGGATSGRVVSAAPSAAFGDDIV